MFYFNARWYDSDIGRFISEDPLWGNILDPQSLNRFAYGRNNPYRFTDPTGRATYSINRTIGGSRARHPFDPISHTFNATFTGDGELKDTYSWGNDFDEENRGKWSKNDIDDITAAEEAFEKSLVTKVGEDSLDEYVEKEYQKREAMHPSLRHTWKFWDNCKHEASDLVDDAEHYHDRDLATDNDSGGTNLYEENRNDSANETDPFNLF